MRTALLLVLLTLLIGCGSGSAPPPIYLGHVATTSGPDRAAGEQEVRGINLAIEELARGGQDRVGERPVQVKHADARGQLDAIEGQAVRLVTVGRVIALYGGDSADEVRRLERSRVPLLAPFGKRPKGSGEHVFATGMAPAAQGQALARFAVLEKDVKRMAVLVDERREQALALAEAFEQAARQAYEEKHGKAEFTKPERLNFGKDVDFGRLGERLSQLRLDGVLFAGSAQDYKVWRKTLPAPAYQLFFGGEDGALTEDGPTAAYLASAFAVDKELPQTVAFARQYREAYKEDPGVHAALAYDGIRILVDALRRAQAVAADGLVKELRQTKDFPGLTGKLTFAADQHLERPIFIGQLAGAGFVPIKRYDPRNP
jgi:branched-chain amino acid transport system substrate-binding protein